MLAKFINQTKVITALTLLIIVSGCGSTPKPPKVDYNQETNFAEFKTFYFEETKPVTEEVNPIYQARIGKAITSALNAKTMVLVEGENLNKQDKSTVAVSFYYSQTVKPQNSSFSIGLGGGSMGSRGGASVGVSKSIPIGSDSLLITKIVINISSQGKAIWHGSDTFEGQNDLPQTEKDKLINKTVTRLLAQYPPSKK
ncbi:MAG: DUF4136 domain-containing protein [Colwellia sp.]